jgi:acetyl esterase/lipase
MHDVIAVPCASSGRCAIRLRSSTVQILIPQPRLHAVLLALAFAVAVPDAAANVPAPVIATQAIRDQALGTAVGTITTRVTYTDTTATAAASTGSTIPLQRGFVFRLRTCVAYHLTAMLPRSACAERTVDTRSGTATVYAPAPSVTLPAQPRPITEPWGYFTPYTEVLRLAATGWQMSAHSWPDNRLQGAGIAVAAQGQVSGTLPANSSVALDGPFIGAVNSGEPDSICTQNVVSPDGSPLPAGVSSSHPAYAGAPAYYEVGMPTGAHAGAPARGVMLVIHGGGWASSGVGAAQSMRPDADRWRARGWITVNLTYRACGQTAADVLSFYDKTRAAVGAGVRVCAIGTSAGGNLALLIGAYRPDLYCAVSQAGPTDLRTIQREVAYDAASGLHTQTFGGRYVHNLAAAAFGEENLPWFSPAALASGTLSRTRVLQAFSADDPLVPYQQTADLGDVMRDANPAAYVDSIQLDIGTIPFAHGRVTQAALDAFYAREERLVAGAGLPAIALSERQTPAPAPITGAAPSP